ncbi:MAG: hypothetical protein EA344_08815 [Alkalicoccus sp.]|nr:MAG: hypothetical protein EA344_08815 [Alkalicoccus sp.]
MVDSGASQDELIPSYGRMESAEAGPPGKPPRGGRSSYLSFIFKAAVVKKEKGILRNHIINYSNQPLS